METFLTLIMLRAAFILAAAFVCAAGWFAYEIITAPEIDECDCDTCRRERESRLK